MAVTVSDRPRKSRSALRFALSRTVGRRIGDAVTYVLLTLGSVVFAGPFLWMVFSSLKTKYEVYEFPPSLLPKIPQWLNYMDVFQNQPFGLFSWNSFYIAITVTFGVLFTSSLAGYSFARIRYPGRDKIFLLYLATMMVPFSVTLIPAFALIRYFGWLDNHAALIVPGLVSAWGTFLMRQFMLGIPRELEDAAFIDGCNRLRIYWTIILPVSRPVIATLGIFTFMGTWNGFLWPLIIISSQENWTLPLGLANFQSRYAYQTPWHLIMAASFITVFPIIVLFILGQKYYVQGIVTSGLKGAA